MTQSILQLKGDPIGAGKERVCYRHPECPGKAVKIQKGESVTQTQRELRFYSGLEKRNMVNFKHLPRFYGQVETNLGPGFVVELISDFDGSVSRSLLWHFEQGYPISEFASYLEEFRKYLVENMIVFSADMSRYNVLFNRISKHEARLVVIDGLGNHSAINFLDSVPWIARRKIKRRWNRFYSKLEHNSAELMEKFDASPRVIDLNQLA